MFISYEIEFEYKIKKKNKNYSRIFLNHVWKSFLNSEIILINVFKLDRLIKSDIFAIPLSFMPQGIIPL